MKTILIDGYNLALEKGAGVATYARNLSFAAHAAGYRVEVLYGLGGAKSRNPLLREIAFFDSPPVPRGPRWLRVAQQVGETLRSPLAHAAHIVPITGKVVAAPFRSRLPYFDALWNVDSLFNKAGNHFRAYKRRAVVRVPSRPAIAHWTFPLPLRLAGAKNVYTLHDLIPLRLPYTTLDVKSRYFRLVARLVRHADHIVTVSECSKRDIVNLLGVPEERVTNTYQAVSIPKAYAEKPLDLVRREIEGVFGLKFQGYFLYFGSIEPKKNVGRLIEAYLAAGIETPLVLVAAQAWKTEEELRLMRNDDHLRYLVEADGTTRVKRKIYQFDYAPFPVLVSLIRGARAVLTPSLYEGFGLPLLEAMTLGTPALASNQSSHPEIGGDAAVLVDPYDTRAMAEAIRRLDEDAELRAMLAARGPRQAEQFSAERYQARLRELYERL